MTPLSATVAPRAAPGAAPWAASLQSEGVLHRDADAGPVVADPRSVRLVVFWRDERPVGQGAPAWNKVLVPPPPLLHEPASAAPERSVSLVICTRDRPQELERCLAVLNQQSLVPDEVVVVDNASLDERTQRVARAAGVRYLREDRPGLDIARNTGARAASGDVVAYVDDDVVLHPDFLRRLAGAFDDEAVLAVTGLVLPAELATPAQSHFETYWGFGRGFARRDFGADFLHGNRKHGCPTWHIGAGAAMAFRREAFERAGYFDERLDVGAAGCSGDSEFWHRVLCAGGVCRYEPAATAFHYHRRDFPGLRKQVRAYMRGHAAALLVQNETARKAGHLRRLFADLPASYLRRLRRRLRRGRLEADRFLGDEVAGLIEGALFYAFAPRPRRQGSL